VTEFLARLEDPPHAHWGKDGDRHARLPTQPAEVADRRQLRMLLLDAPEALSDEGAEFCVEAGIGFIRSRSACGRPLAPRSEPERRLWTMSRTCGCSLDRFRMPMHPDSWICE
jgi:hypothetical protein